MGGSSIEWDDVLAVTRAAQRATKSRLPDQMQTLVAISKPLAAAVASSLRGDEARLVSVTVTVGADRHGGR
jgi:hypothetical protein